MNRARVFLLSLCVMLLSIPQGVSAAPVVRTISGFPLAVNVGDDASFQVFDANVPGAGQVFPTSNSATADMGVFVRRAGTLYAPFFASHPGGTGFPYTTYTVWTPVSISNVTGTGTSSDPFTVVVVADAAETGLRMTLTVTYVNGDNFFRKAMQLSSTVAQTFDVFLGADLYLATSDSGVPYFTAGAVGGQTCAPNPPYTILLIALTPEDRYAGEYYLTIWGEIIKGALSNVVDSVCEDNGAALQWENRTIGSSGGSVTIQAATSFGGIPVIATFRVASVTPSQGTQGQNLTATVQGVGFQSGTTFSFGSDVAVTATRIDSSTQATVGLSIAPGANPGFRDVIGRQTVEGPSSTLTQGFEVIAAIGRLVVSPSSYSFQPQTVGYPTSLQYFTLTNAGQSVVTLTGIMSTSPQFQVDSGSTNCNQSTVLPPNASCQIGVVFSPSAEGQQSGSIVVSTIPASVSQTIPLQGNGHYNLVELPF